MQLVERSPLEQFADQERLSVSSPDSCTAQTCGWVTSEAIRASRRKRSIAPGLRDFLRPQQLDRDLAIEPQVAGAIDLAGAVPADGLEELVVGDPHRLNGVTDVSPRLYFSAAYSARAARSGGKSASAAARAEQVLVARRAPRRSPARGPARARPSDASGTTGDIGSTPRCLRIRLVLAAAAAYATACCR